MECLTVWCLHHPIAPCAFKLVYDEEAIRKWDKKKPMYHVPWIKTLIHDSTV